MDGLLIVALGLASSMVIILEKLTLGVSFGVCDMSTAWVDNSKVSVLLEYLMRVAMYLTPK